MLFKQGASADLSQSIAQIYRMTGIEFGFSDQTLEKVVRFVEGLVAELQDWSYKIGSDRKLKLEAHYTSR